MGTSRVNWTTTGSVGGLEWCSQKKLQYEEPSRVDPLVIRREHHHPQGPVIQDLKRLSGLCILGQSLVGRLYRLSGRH